MRTIAQRDDIRDLILDGVDALLARFGFKKMTMADLAREVGIGKGTIYLHFPGKEELVLAHVDRIAERLLLRLRQIAAGPGSPPERLRRMLLVRVLFRFDSVTHYSQNLDDLLSSVRIPLLARRGVHFEKEAAVLAEVLRDGCAQGVFNSAGMQMSARALVGCTNSFLPFSLSARELGERDELEKRLIGIVDLLLNGLLRRSSGPSKRRR